MKTSKRIVSFLLSAIMVVTTFLAVGPVFTIEAEAATSLGGITQEHVVGNYEAKYKEYQAKFFGENGADNWPTDMVIPGLSSTVNYTPQGMTYWHAKEWILISAYDADEVDNSVIYAIDIKTGSFVALFKIFNSDGTINKSHGGGIAASEYNFYYADKGSYISYWPLSEMDVADNTVKDIYIKGSIDCSGEFFGGRKAGASSPYNDESTTESASTSFCCYDDGILWTGNFYYKKKTSYSTSANSTYNSMVYGYKLYGDSSEQEWHYLANRSIPIDLYSNNTDNTAGVMTYKTTKNADGSVNITGTTNASAAQGEITPEFATFELNAGQKYIIEFISTNTTTDMYMWSPVNTHCGISSSSDFTRTSNNDGTYTYRLVFTAGVKPNGADSGWPAAANSSYTGTYRIRFDQDSIPAGAWSFAIKNFTIKPYSDSIGADATLEGSNCAGNPTYCIALHNDIDKVQYAMVDKGKLYISRSWDRSGSGSNHVRALAIADININYPGTKDLTINGQSRKCHFIDTAASTFKQISGSNMLYMGEALCVIDDYLYMFSEGAAWYYNGATADSKCDEPIDVIWKIDQYAIAGNPRSVTEDIKAIHYEKVKNIGELKSGEEYIIAFESTVKDRATQKNILYALDSYGGYGGKKLPKYESANKDATGDSMGIVGYKITSYSTEGNQIYFDDEIDARKSIRWTVTHNGSGGELRLANMDHFYSQNSYLNFDFRIFTMSSASSSEIKTSYLTVEPGPAEGRFYIYSTNGGSASYLWCNDGSELNPTGLDIYTNYYRSQNLSYTASYAGVNEVAGTFHSDGLYKRTSSDSGNVMKKEVPDYSLGQVCFYKRVPDQHTYTAETQIYTDFKAEVQSDGTYDLTLDTYATASLQYRKLDSARPTDYILVLDTSSSMVDNRDCIGYRQHAMFDLEAAAGNGNVASHTNNSSNSGTTATYTGNMWIQHTDGVMCQVSVKVQGDGRNSNIFNRTYYQRVYLWYTHPKTGEIYWFHPNPDNERGVWTASATTYDQAMRIGGTSQNERKGRVVYEGVCYEYRVDSNRLDNMKTVAKSFATRVTSGSKNANNRVAVVQFGNSAASAAGTNTGLFNQGNTSMISVVGFGNAGGNTYAKALYSSSQIEELKSRIDGISVPKDGDGEFDYANVNTYTDYGLNMASNIVKNSGANYLYGGDRSACIIVITDGAPGHDNSAQLVTAQQIQNTAIEFARDAKELGAYVYTVRISKTELANFNTTAFLSYTSSEHIDAFDADNVGSKNTQKSDYTIEIAGNGFNCNTFVDTLIKETDSNSLNALAKLDANAIIREKLNLNAFDLSQSTIQVGTQKAKYDGAMRLSFEDELTLLEEGGENADGTLQKDYVFNRTTGEFKVTNYDYSSNYVATHTVNAGTANKLTIKISNVWPSKSEINTGDINSDYVNVLANIEEPTGVYAKQSDMTATGGDKHKGFPVARVVVPQYTYVLDYGIGMLDVDIDGTLISVDTQFRPQRAADGTLNSRYIEAGGTKLAFANEKQDMIYSIDRTATQMQRYYVLIQRPNDEYDWFAINIVPASTVYYEENIFSNYISGNTRWSRTGNATVTNQGISLWDDVYGYDEKYLADTSNNSGGTVLTTTVSSGNKQSDTYRTNFIGDAFDLYSACGDSTGILVVGVRKNDGTNNGRGTLVKSYVVDTFYNDSTYGTLYQVPVIHCEDLAYGNYFVEVTSAYLSISGKLKSQSFATEIIDENNVISYTSDFTNDTESVILEELGFAELDPENTEFIWYSEDSVLNGGMGAQGVNNGSFTTQADGDVTLTSYIDGLRAYNPTNGVSSYYKAEEQDAKYYNVFDNMKAGTFTGEGVSYLLGGTAGGTTLNFATELETLFQGRPKNEVYLESGNKITFTVNGLDTDSRVMVSLRAAAGTPKASVNNKQFNVTSKMEMYYDVTDYVTKSSDGKSATVIIENVSGGMLAIDNIKLTGKETTLSGQSLLSDIIEIFAEPVEEVVPNQPKPQVSENSGEIPAPPELPDVSDPDDGNDDNGNDDIVPPSDDNNNPEEPAEDGFFTKVESFFVEIFNFFKNIFNKVSSFFKF